LAETTFSPPKAQQLGVTDALRVFYAPVALFRRVEDTGAYGWPLVVLLLFVALIGYAEVKTGLIERVVQSETEMLKAKLEHDQRDLIGQVEFRNELEKIDKAAQFSTLMAQIKVAAASPIYVLASILLISSCLYAVVALTGRKPEYHTLISICVYAEFVELAAYAVRLGMRLTYRTIEVDTSLGMLATSKAWLWLTAIDPFRLWFWVLVGIGVAVTRQLSRRTAIIACSAMGLVATAGWGLKEYLRFLLGG
jgi:hypothetical protein